MMSRDCRSSWRVTLEHCTRCKEVIIQRVHVASATNVPTATGSSGGALKQLRHRRDEAGRSAGKR
jgi:hypothetical protein